MSHRNNNEKTTICVHDKTEDIKAFQKAAWETTEIDRQEIERLKQELCNMKDLVISQIDL